MRRVGMILLALVGVPSVVAAQYFGRNRVQYGRFDFQIIQTEHFDLYYYPEARAAALDAARMAERSYARLSRVLNHEFTERKPIILYASHSDFQQTNLGGGDPDESTGGFTDFLRHRNTFPLTGHYGENEHVLAHEMVHQFQFDIWSRGRGGAGIQGIFSANAPLWFGEGMAEYFSLGPADSKTAMWLRDGAIEGRLPSAGDFTRVFPYQYGHAIISYIGQRWGDEAIGAITKNATGGGVNSALRRVLGLNFGSLVNQWADAVQKQYLPEIGERVKARRVARPVITDSIAKGTWHLAPALSPDGSRIAYFGDRGTFFVDMWLADGNTGEHIRRILKSSYSSNYETFRYLSSSAAWSADGKYLAFAAKRSGKDDILIVDPFRNKTVKRITLPISGVTTPTFSPDGEQLVFTGLDGGVSDLYVVRTDGTDLRRLTNDRNADMHPVWSPDGRTIAFASDRGPETDFDRLVWSNLRLTLYHLEDGRIEVLPGMEHGRNSSPQWAPDGRSIAFVSDRDEVANLFLFDLDDREVYQLTDFYTGIQGITPLSPVLSWSAGSDRIAFVYFELGKYDVYSLANPRSFKRAPWRADGRGPTVLVETRSAQNPGPRFQPDSAANAARTAEVLASSSLYRTRAGFRPTDSLTVETTDSAAAPPQPESIARLLDSVTIHPPDTTDFVYRPYKAKFEPEYVARPTIGYVRDNFGRGVTGSATIVLGDMLSNKQMIFGASLNGRLAETQLLAQYVNQTRRLNWAVGVQQSPFFFYEGQFITDGTPTASEATLSTSLRRLVFRNASILGYYPFSRFTRIEGGFQIANVQDDRLEIVEPFDRISGIPTRNPSLETTNLGSFSYLAPSIAYVHDNSLYGYLGPFVGRRARFEVAQNLNFIGDGWRFTSVTADYRRYDRLPGPFTLATRGLFFGRIGRDERSFRFFGGSTELIRGWTAGSFQRNECRSLDQGGTIDGCNRFDELIGTRAAVFNAELRFPILTSNLTFIRDGLPIVEGAFFYDAGVFWESGQSVKLSREGTAGLTNVRTPLQSVGFSVRGNLLNFLILRVDYSRPLNRTGVGGLWTLSLGPTF